MTLTSWNMIVPAVAMGIILGPLAAKFLDAMQWGSAAKDQQFDITLVGLVLQSFDSR